MPTESVIYKGRKYTRYPDSPRRDMRVYFSSGGHRRLHRDVYADHNGPIPKGYHVHHKDENPLNNEPGNLELLPGREHLSLHSSKPEHIAKLVQYLPRAREALREWNKSDAAKQLRVGQGRRTNLGHHPVAKKCVHCGGDWIDEQGRNTNRYCSKKCKAAARRASGVDNESRVCVRCGAEFIVNRYWVNKHCGHKCAGLDRWAARRAGV